MKDRKRVLFSPIGTTDPIRDCYDGGCLHIVRHYRPQKVVLYLMQLHQWLWNCLINDLVNQYIALIRI